MTQIKKKTQKNCGNGLNISHHFLLSHKQESFRKYPNFELICIDKRPVLPISDDDCSSKVSFMPIIPCLWLMLLSMRKPVELLCITLALIQLHYISFSFLYIIFSCIFTKDLSIRDIFKKKNIE